MLRRTAILLLGLAVAAAGLVLLYAALPASIDAGPGAGPGTGLPAGPDAGAPAGPGIHYAVQQQTCVDDVSISNIFMGDGSNGNFLLDPPDYPTDTLSPISIYYDAANRSCKDVTVKVEMRGTVSNALIYNDDEGETCSNECTIAAGDTKYGGFLWDLSQHPATSSEAVVATIIVKAPAGFSDADASNNSATSTDTINILAAASATPTPTPTPTPAPVTDVALTAVTVPESAVIIGETAAIGVTVANRGNVAAANIALALYVGDDESASATGTVASIAVGGTATASLSWDTGGKAPGTHSLRVKATVDGDANTADNSRTASVALRKPQVDVGFTGSISAPEVAVIGSAVTLNATIANRGEADVEAPLRLYVDGSSVAKATATTDTIAAGASITASIEWDTTAYANLTGDYELELKVEMADDASDGDNSLSATVKLFLSAFEDGDDDTPAACTDDVRVKVFQIRDIGDIEGTLRSPPNYKTSDDDTLDIAYDVYNYACESEVTVTVKLTGATTGIEIAGSDEPCISEGCPIPAGGRIETAAWWQLSEWQEVAGEKIKAVVEITQPSDFVDTNTANNTHTSQQGVDISYPKDIVVGLGIAESDKGKIKAALAPFDFGQVKVRLVSAQASATIPYGAASVPLRITAANDGEEKERVVVTVNLAPPPDSAEEPKLLLEQGVSIPAMQSSDFTLSAPAAEFRVGSNSIAVRISAVNDAPSDNAAALNITREPAPLDAEITGITASPPGSTMQGQEVVIRVAVRNDGPEGANIPVQLAFPSASKRPETKSPWVKSGAAGVAVFTWQTRNYSPGVHTLRASVTATNNIADGDTSRTLQYRITPLVLSATIVDIASAPGSPVVGEPVTITVTARNNGPIYGALPVTLHFPGEGKQPETRRPRIAVGATGTAVFTWRTGRYSPGTHTFRVQAGGDAARSFNIDLLEPTADFAVTGLYRSDPEPSRPVVKGDWVALTAQVANLGPYAGRSLLTLRDLTEQQGIDREAINLEPGQSGEATLTWKTLRYAVGEHRLQVISDAAYDHNAGNDASNIVPLTILTDRDVTIGVADEAPGQLVAGGMAAPDVDTAPHIVRYIIKEVQTAPEDPVVGHPVRITVTVHNAGTHAANVPITLHFPAEGKQPETRSPRIAPGQDAEAAFTWRTSRYHYGDHTFRVEAPTAETKVFTAALLPPTVDFTVVELYPVSPGYPIVKGDWVEVATFVRNAGPESGRARIILRDLTERRSMYGANVSLAPGETRIVAFTWKTLRYELGEHRLQAMAEASHDASADNDHSDVVTATILTNRDITIGFGGVIPEQVAGAMSAPRILTHEEVPR